MECLQYSIYLFLVFELLFHVVGGQGSLSPNGMVYLDCGSEQNFTCDVSAISGAEAAWAINLDRITLPTVSGLNAARSNNRITSNDTSSGTSKSFLTITGFSEADSNGTVQCLAASSVEGLATIVVGIPSCPLNKTGATAIDCDRANVTWQQPPSSPLITFTTVTFCPILSPNCTNSMTCTSPCTIRGLDPGTEYQFTVIPNNDCGSSTGCIGSTATARTPCLCAVRTSEPTSIVVPVLAGTIPSTVSIILNIITGIGVFLITRHCYKKTSQKSCPSKGEDVYREVSQEGPKTYEDIVMTDSPAYGPVT